MWLHKSFKFFLWNFVALENIHIPYSWDVRLLNHSPVLTQFLPLRSTPLVIFLISNYNCSVKWVLTLFRTLLHILTTTNSKLEKKLNSLYNSKKLLYCHWLKAGQFVINFYFTLLCNFLSHNIKKWGIKWNLTQAIRDILSNYTGLERMAVSSHQELLIFLHGQQLMLFLSGKNRRKLWAMYL